MRTLCIAIVMFAACGDDGGNNRSDAHVDLDSPTGGVPAVAHMLHGAMVPAMAMAGPPVAGAASDGNWYVTPDQAKVGIEMINFAGYNGSPSVSAGLSNCFLTFSKSTPSLASLLDCPFTVLPGTYSGMTIHINGTFEVLVNDVADGIYTDPAAVSKLSSTAPSGGAGFIQYTRPLGGTGIESQFPTPLVVAEGDTVSLAVVLDAIQTLRISVSGSVLSFGDMNQIPVNIFATLDAPGVARYLTTSGTAESYNDSSVLANIVRVYYAANNGQPVYLFTEQTAGAINGCSTPAPAYPIDPSTSITYGDGSKIGGWLGRDSSQTTCWAVGSNKEWTGYRAYFTLGNTTAVGDSATLSCDATASPTPPTSGSTYASGCPAITADATGSLTLVAQ